MQNRNLRIHDDSLRSAAARLEEFSQTVQRRVAEHDAATTRIDAALALFEAKVASVLVESAAQEVALRLLSHGVRYDAAAQSQHRLAAYRRAIATYEQMYGALPEA